MIRIPGIPGGLRACASGTALLCTLLLAGCGGGGGDDGGGGGPPAPTLTLTATPATLNAGASVTLSWSTANATSCTASGGWSGSKPTSGSQDVAVASGSTTFTLGCTGAGGSISRSATVTASAPGNPPPAITFTTNSSAVMFGGSFTLNWSAANASTCTASGGWSGAKATAGSEIITSASTGAITYTLACTGPGGNATQSTTVTVNAVPPTLTLVAIPTTVAVGDPMDLEWISTNATSCTASGAWGGNRPTSGIVGFTAVAAGTATFTLTCTGAGGSITQSATVTITPLVVGQPYIVVTVMGFNPGTSVSGILSSSKTALAYVDVWNQAVTAPVPTATVSINGTPLPYSASLQTYVAELNLLPGATITASVTVEGTEYESSIRQFDTYPVISTPLDDMSWAHNSPNEIRWHGTSSRPGAQVLLRMLGPTAAQDWPTGGWIEPAPGATSHVVPADALSTNDYVLLVGYADVAEFTGARPGSAFILGGFDHRHVSVIDPPPLVTNVTKLVFKTLPPAAVGVNGTKQMSVQGTVNCCAVSDWTTMVSWSSSDPNVLAVNDSGIVMGVAPGTADVIAAYNGISVSMPVRVYQAPPLPDSPPTASTSFQVDHTHAGFLTLGTAPTLPLSGRWTVTLEGRVSYPVVADGRVFVTVARIAPPNSVLGTSVYALDVNTGATLWGPVEHSTNYMWSAHTYANGRLFVLSATGLLRALDASTGAEVWSVQMPGSMGYSAPPVAVNGLVYLSAPGGQMLAVSQEDGSTLWSASVLNGMSSSPTLGSDGLYVSYACDAYRLDPLSGEKIWHFRGACSSGGGGRTTVLEGNSLFAAAYTGSGVAFRTFNASDGAIIDGFSTSAMPAVAGGIAYFVTSGQLHAVDTATNATLWTYEGDSSLNTTPLVIDNTVAVGSSTGAVYLIDRATGNQLWSDMAAAGVNPTSEGPVLPPSGLGAGGGFLLVPGGSTLTGWKLVP